jgi:5-dehydro-4-deoxyglucarate dehydratase
VVDSGGPQDVAERLRVAMNRSVLSFPLTPFDDSGALDLEGFRLHVKAQIEAGPGAIFVACGTGEFFSLSLAEYEQVVSVAVDVAAGRLPVVAGIGYGTAMAVEFAEAAVRSGVDAGLLMPPYLVEAPQAGIAAHIRGLTSRTALPLIIYQRAQVKLSVETVTELGTIANVIGIKDGHGDLDQMQRIRLVAPDRWLFFNGVATAEMQAAAYRSIGVPAYSSAVHAFAPEIAHAFFGAMKRGDEAIATALLREFYLPLVELRDKGTGYAVALVKAGARLRGAQVGSVRAPLSNPTPDHLAELEELLATGLRLAGRQ